MKGMPLKPIQLAVLCGLLPLSDQSGYALDKLNGKSGSLPALPITINQLFKKTDKDKKSLLVTGLTMTVNVVGGTSSIKGTWIDVYSNTGCTFDGYAGTVPVTTGTYRLNSGSNPITLDGGALYALLSANQISNPTGPTGIQCIVLNFGDNADYTLSNYSNNPTGACPQFPVSCAAGSSCVSSTGTITVSYATGSASGALCGGILSETPIAYVVNYGTGSSTTGVTGTVSLINTANNATGPIITVGLNPAGIAFTPDGAKAYVANNGINTATGTVSVINTANNSVTGAAISVGVSPGPIAITGTTAYVVNTTGAIGGSGPTISLIDTTTDSITGPTGGIVLGFTSPATIAITGATGYVSSLAGVVEFVDLNSNTVNTGITGLTFPVGIEIVGATGYVVDANDNGATGAVELFDPVTVSLITGAGLPILMGGVSSIAIAITGATGYVPNNNGGATGTVTPFNLSTYATGASITVGVNVYAIAIAGETGYVVNYVTGGTVTPFNTITSTTGAAINVGAYPFTIAIRPQFPH